jgi:competence protein ComEA
MDGGWRDRIARLTGRRIELLVVVGVVVLATLVSVALWTRNRPAVIAPPAKMSEAGSSAILSVSPSPSLLVDVAGAVRKPGVYGLVQGDRIQDAIEAAGGAKRSADLSALNLAQLVTDGQKIDVIRRGASVVPATASTAGAISASPTPGAPVSINSADEPTLETIPGVGPVTAQKIIDYRTQHGAFTSIEQLLDIDGIGDVTLENLRPYVSL